MTVTLLNTGGFYAGLKLDLDACHVRGSCTRDVEQATLCGRVKCKFYNPVQSHGPVIRCGESRTTRGTHALYSHSIIDHLPLAKSCQNSFCPDAHRAMSSPQLLVDAFAFQISSTSSVRAIISCFSDPLPPSALIDVDPRPIKFCYRRVMS